MRKKMFLYCQNNIMRGSTSYQFFLSFFTSVKTHTSVINLPFFRNKYHFNKKFDFHGWHKNMTSTSMKKRRISCPCCGSTNLCLLEHETYCRECGLVLQGVPSVNHYIYGYIIGGKRQMYTDKGG